MFGIGNKGRAREFARQGDAARDRREWDAAAFSYSRALSEDPELTAIQVQYGHALKESGRLAEAISAYREAINQDPGNADAHLQLGHALKLNGNQACAILAYSQSVLLDPRAREAKRELKALKAPIPVSVGKARKSANAASSICYDVSDLLQYFRHSRTPTGIQRVQINVVESQLVSPSKGVDVRVISFAGDENYWTEIDPAAFLSLCELARSGNDRNDPLWSVAVNNIHEDVTYGDPFEFQEASALINLGTSWWLQNYFLAVRNAKEKFGIYYLPFVHDCIPIITPEHCSRGLTQDFISWLSGVFHHADGFVVNSKATAEDLKFVARIIGHAIDEPAIVYLDGRFDPPLSSAGSSLRAEGKDGEPYVLFVSTIESRKNHGFCFDAWLQLIKLRGLDNTPNLVCVGKMGWLVEAALARRESSDLLKQKVVLLSGISDGELARLYKECLFTVYPSSYEGWGLPVTESLSYGKVPLVASNSSLTEAGGDLAVYFDLQSQRDFITKIENLIDDAAKRGALERKIADNFSARDWSAIAGEIQAAALKVQTKRPAGMAPGLIHLGQYQSLARNTATVIWEKMPVGERFRIGSGWNSPEKGGCWMSGRQAEIAFRVPDHNVKDGNLLVIISLRGLPAEYRDAEFSIEALGTGVKSQGKAACESIRQTLHIPVGAIKDSEIRIRLTSNPSVDLADVTVGVEGFMVCWEDDLVSRLRFWEAVQYAEPNLLLQRPPGAGDYAKYRN